MFKDIFQNKFTENFDDLTAAIRELENATKDYPTSTSRAKMIEPKDDPAFMANKYTMLIKVAAKLLAEPDPNVDIIHQRLSQLQQSVTTWKNSLSNQIDKLIHSKLQKIEMITGDLIKKLNTVHNDNTLNGLFMDHISPNIFKYLSLLNLNKLGQTCSFFHIRVKDLITNDNKTWQQCFHNSKSLIKNVIAIHNQTFLIRSDGKVLVCGENAGYKLGLDPKSTSNRFVQIKGLDKITHLSSGDNFTLFLDESKKLQVFKHYVDEKKSSRETASVLHDVKVGTEIKSIEGNNYGTYLITEDDSVMGFNCLSYQFQDLSIPSNVNLPLTDIKQVSVGQRNTKFLKYDGTSINYNYCQNLIFTQDHSDTRQVAMGGCHYLFLGNDGKVYGDGNNNKGQLGLGSTCIFYEKTTPIPKLEDIVQIAAGKYHTLCLKKDGTVWVFGLNSDGQLGLGHTKTQYTPVQIPNLTKVTHISAGDYHSVFLKGDTVLTCGKNTQGQLGLGHKYPMREPTKVPLSMNDLKSSATVDNPELVSLKTNTGIAPK